MSDNAPLSSSKDAEAPKAASFLNDEKAADSDEKTAKDKESTQTYPPDTTTIAESKSSADANPGENTAAMPLDWTQVARCPADAIRFPHQVAEWSTDEDEIIVVGTAGQKITRMGDDLDTRVCPKLKKLILRSHLIQTMEGLRGMTSLELLELYDNRVDALQNLVYRNEEGGDDTIGGPGPSLTVLDMSFNVIRDMEPVQDCPNLVELYLANNKLKTMAGLKNLSKLRKIDLGANRIREMDPDQLSGLVNLEELWLGKNKIELIQGLEKLTKLRRLDIQSNRLTVIENLSSVAETLEELYLAHNGITNEGTPGLQQAFPNLSTLDLSRNRLTDTASFAPYLSRELDELWLSGNQIASFEAVEPLSHNTNLELETIYLEYNPVAQEFEYRIRLKALLPSLRQIDDTMIRPATASTTAASRTNTFATASTGESRMKQLQEQAIARAKRETEQHQATEPRQQAE